jgi:hypothetical protein
MVETLGKPPEIKQRGIESKPIMEKKWKTKVLNNKRQEKTKEQMTDGQVINQRANVKFKD